MSSALLSIRPDQDFWDTKQLSALKDQMGLEEDVTNVELAAFMHLCQMRDLDPFTGQIHLVGRYDKRKGRKVYRSQTSIDGYRIVAQRSGEYRGQTSPEWCGPDGQWVDVWLPVVPPSAARIGVYREGFEAPVMAVAKWTSYAQTNKQGNLTGLWVSMPDHMLAKCAEALALRKAFPQDLSGLYTTEEMGQADGVEIVDDEAPRSKKRTAQRKPIPETPEPSLEDEPVDAEVVEDEVTPDE
jgi:phage recombination protein Bet